MLTLYECQRKLRHKGELGNEFPEKVTRSKNILGLAKRRCYNAGRAAALEAVTQGGGYGVVPAAGVTGQDQYAHFALLSAALAFAAAPPGA